MTLNEIEQALGSIIHLAWGHQMVWPNMAAPDPLHKPYIALQHVPTSRSSGGVSGGVEKAGYIQITVVHEALTTTVGAQADAESIAALFHAGQRIPCGSGFVTIAKPPEPLSGYRDGADWRVPVRIDYRS